MELPVHKGMGRLQKSHTKSPSTRGKSDNESAGGFTSVNPGGGRHSPNPLGDREDKKSTDKAMDRATITAY